MDFTRFGGVQGHLMGHDPSDPAAVTWNFGILPKTEQVMQDSGRTLYETFPNLQGRWDGSSTVSHHQAVKRVLGKFLEPHSQVAGLCGGHAASRGLELLQCILIASGKQAKFKRVSHAWPYFLARREYGMLGGGDGVPDGSIPPVLAKYGALHREESGDLYWDGAAADKVGVSWGSGRLSRGEVAALEALAADNIVTAMVKVSSAQELADGLASGGIGICSDSRGYEMTRDSEGICSPRGTWYHYHVRSGVRRTPYGRKVFEYNQSWGNQPTGPLLDGCPANVFGVDWEVDDQNCRNGSFHVLFGFGLWELESGNFDIEWLF